MLTNTAVFFIHWKKSLLQSPLVAGVKEQATTMKSDSAASLGVDTGGAQGSVRCCVPGQGQLEGGKPDPSLPPSMDTPKMLPKGSVPTRTALITAQSVATHGILGCYILQSAPCSKGGETEAREEQKLIRGHTAGSRPHCFHLCQGPMRQQGGVAEIQLGFCSPRYAPARGLDSPRGKAEGQRSPVYYGNCEPKFPALPYLYHPYTEDSLHVTTFATALCTWTTVRRDLTGQEPRVSDTEGTRCRLAESLRCPNRPLQAGQGSQIKPRAHHGPVELLHSAPKCCHYGKRRTTRPSPRGPCGNPGFTYQTLPGIPLLPEAWAGALCIEISGHRMVSDAEQWPGLVARVKSQRLFPSPQRARAGTVPREPLGEGLGGKVPSYVN